MSENNNVDDNGSNDNGNNNNDPNNGDDEEILPAEKARKQYMLERELAQFGRLYYARIPEDQICRELQISRSTYYRYLDRLGDQEKELLTEHNDTSRYAEIASFRNAMRFVEINMRKILMYKESLDTDKIEAARLLLDTSWANVKLHTQGPIQTMKQMPADLKKRVENAKQTPPPQLVEIKTEEIVQDNNNVGESKQKKEDNATQQGS